MLTSATRAHGQRRGQQARRNENLAERLHIAEDGTVTLFTSKVEVGQGSRTQITQAAAEELRIPVEQVQLVMADTARCPDDGGTAGSRTTPSTVPRVRNACAAARERLIDLAASAWGVQRNAVRYDHGTFVASAEKSLTLGDLASDSKLVEAFDQPPDSDLLIRPVANWSVLGTPTKKVGGEAIVTGRHKYPSDIQLPGMLYGKVLRAPAYNAKLKTVDLTSAQAMPGVNVVRDGDFIGCAAPTSWQATKALESIAASADWQRSEASSSKNLYDRWRRTAGGGSPRGGRGGGAWGDLKNALEGSDQQLRSSYEIAYIQHAPMEPRAAVAQWEDGKLTVWAGTQQPARRRRATRGVSD